MLIKTWGFQYIQWEIGYFKPHGDTYLKLYETPYGSLLPCGINDARMATLTEFPTAAYITQDMAFQFFWENTGVVLKPQKFPACQKILLNTIPSPAIKTDI